MVLGLGTWEFLLVGLALLMFFGPEHAPGAIRKLGEWQGRFQNMLKELESAVEDESEPEPDYSRLNMGDDGAQDEDEDS